jgi:hypothetical protein
MESARCANCSKSRSEGLDFAVSASKPTTSISPGRELDPIEIDARPCELCGLTIDRHDQEDDGDGPLFYCPDLSPDEMTLIELERRAELRFQEGVAAILARMDAMERPRDPPPREPEPYRPAQSTFDAFRLVTASGDTARIKAWLADRPKDALLLLASLESLETC